MKKLNLKKEMKYAKLPPRQLQVFVFIEREIDDKGISPTLEEIATANEMQPAQAAQIVRDLIVKGRLKSTPGKHRSIEIVKQ